MNRAKEQLFSGGDYLPDDQRLAATRIRDTTSHILDMAAGILFTTSAAGGNRRPDSLELIIERRHPSIGEELFLNLNRESLRRKFSLSETLFDEDGNPRDRSGVMVFLRKNSILSERDTAKIFKVTSQDISAVTRSRGVGDIRVHCESEWKQRIHDMDKEAIGTLITKIAFGEDCWNQDGRLSIEKVVEILGIADENYGVNWKRWKYFRKHHNFPDRRVNIMFIARIGRGVDFKEWFEHQHLREGRSLEEIAQQLNVSTMALDRYCIENNISRQPRGSRAGIFGRPPIIRQKFRDQE